MYGISPVSIKTASQRVLTALLNYNGYFTNWNILPQNSIFPFPQRQNTILT